MLRTVSELEGYTIGATDDTVGQVSDLYFDDRVWTRRLLVRAQFAALKSPERL